MAFTRKFAAGMVFGGGLFGVGLLTLVFGWKALAFFTVPPVLYAVANIYDNARIQGRVERFIRDAVSFTVSLWWKVIVAVSIVWTVIITVYALD